jgi:hypothetical protein
MADDELKFVSEKISKEADSYAKRECPNPDTRFFYWKAYVAGANRALEMAMNALEQSSIWSGTGYKVSYRELYQRLCELHNYPEDFDDRQQDLAHSEVTKISDQDGPASKDWIEAYRNWVMSHGDGDTLYCKNAWKAAMDWQKQQMMKDAADGELLAIEDCNYSMNSHTHLEMYVDEVKLIEKGFKDGDEVKLIIIKED